MHIHSIRNMIMAAGLLLCLNSPAIAGSAEVTIQKFSFIPQEITVGTGDTVTWTNREKRQFHSVWFEQAGDPEAPYIFPGETYQRTFDAPGTYPYRCGPHPKMTGTVIVK